jgi:signal peptidase II
MQKGKSLGSWRNVGFLLTMLLVVCADQISKAWIRSSLAVGQSLPETGFLRLTHIHNTGAVFGLFQDCSRVLSVAAFISATVLLLCAFVFCRWFSFLDNNLGRLVLGLVLGGTIGNLIDRLYFGYVTDFIDVGIWPSFNVADSAVVIGAIIFVYSLRSLILRAEKRGDGKGI